VNSVSLENIVFLPIVFLECSVEVKVKLPHLILAFTFFFLDVFDHILGHDVIVHSHGVDQLISVNIENLVADSSIHVSLLKCALHLIT
jgi:hypothetical protein